MKTVKKPDKQKNIKIDTTLKNKLVKILKNKLTFIKKGYIELNETYIVRLPKINNEFSKVCNLIIKNNMFKDNCLVPSIFILHIKDTKIKPFWNNEIQKVSDILYMPSINNIYQSANNKTFKSNTWFEVQTYAGINKNKYNVKINNLNNQVADKIITKNRKILMYLTKDQQYYIKHIIGAYRYFYNRCVDHFNNYNKKTKKSYFLVNPKDTKTKIEYIADDPYSMFSMRKILKSNKPNWLILNYPSHLIDEAFREAFSRFTTCLNTCIKKGIKFEFKYKTKKDIVQTINLEKTMISKNCIFKNWKINNEYVFRDLKLSEKIIDGYVGSTISYHTVTKKYRLNLNYKTKVNIQNLNKNSICAIDQGEKCPFTVFSVDNIVKIGKDSREKLYKVCKEVDIITSRMTRSTYYVKKIINGETVKKNYIVSNKRKKQLRNALHRKMEYIKNLKDELHKKTINYLCKNYRTIILPPFEIKKMVEGLSNKISRSLYTFAFYQFKEKLKLKCDEYGTNLFTFGEQFTSQTCTKCGNIKSDLRNANVYNCLKCGLSIDRDMSGARNIFLRNIINL